MRQPCFGLSPLKDEDMDIEYDCGENTERKTCPAFSYCHKTNAFSKCCPFPKKVGKINYIQLTCPNFFLYKTFIY